MKWLTGIVVTILILAAIGLGVWYFFGEQISNYWFNQKSSTAIQQQSAQQDLKPDNFKPYENQTYNYRVYYPSDWDLSSDTDGNSAVAKLLADKNNSAGLRVEVSVSDNTQRLLLDHFIQRYNQAQGIEPIAEQAVEISGITAVKQMTNVPTMMTLIHFRKDYKIYTITFTGPAAQYEQDIGAFSKIYHSFIFI